MLFECLLSAFGYHNHMNHKPLLPLLKEHSLYGGKYHTVEITCIWLGMVVNASYIYSSIIKRRYIW